MSDVRTKSVSALIDPVVRSSEPFIGSRISTRLLPRPRTYLARRMRTTAPDRPYFAIVAPRCCPPDSRNEQVFAAISSGLASHNRGMRKCHDFP
jgi:hypothetical protein